MKKHFVFLFLVCFSTYFCFSQPGWMLVSSPVEENLISVCFNNTQQGWILSSGGTLISTTNGGQSWQTSALGNGTFTSVYFPDADNGYITGYEDSSFIMKTGDGGQSWQYAEHPKALRLNDVYFSDTEHGWAVGIRNGVNYVLYTADGGQEWASQSSILVQEAELNSVSFRDNTSGSTCGADGAFFVTNSGGVSGWAVDISIPSLGVDLYDVYNWGMFTGCAVGSDGTALYTTNWWSSYVETNTNTTATLHGVSGDPVTNKLWAAGEGGTIIYTSNYLLGWITQPTGTTENLNSIDMIDDELGWAVGDNGTILRYGTGTGTDEMNIPGSGIQVRIYPNPGRGIYNLQFTNCNLQPVSVTIYDFHMHKMAAFPDARMQAGDHIMQLDLKGLPEGVYLLKSRVGNETISRKIVLM
jgi:photosystem II stability/assembly factor-like uncharacterized protein